MSKKLIIIGGPGKGGPIAECVEHNRTHYNDLEYEVLGFLNDQIDGRIKDFPVLGKVKDYKNFLSDPDVYFIFAIHQVQNNFIADELFETLEIPIERFATIIHKSCIILRGAKIEPGVVILGHSYVSNVHLKFGSLVMPGVVLSHDAVIGPLAFISTGCIIGSFVTIGKSAFVSMSASIIELNTVEDYAIVAAGAVVNCTVPSKTIYGGVPAKYIKDVK